MTVFAMKLIAVASMIIDHTAYMVYTKGLMAPALYEILRGIGRIAFPIYCFLLVNGFDKTSDRTRYASRLILFAAVSQLPYSMLFSFGNYLDASWGGLTAGMSVSPLLWLGLTLAVCALWFALVRRDASVVWLALAMLIGNLKLHAGDYLLLSRSLNVFYTLAFGLLLMCWLELLWEKERDWLKIAACGAALFAAMYFYLPHSDYAWNGLALIVLLYAAKNRKWLQALFIALWCVCMYINTSLLWAAVGAASALTVLLYNGKRGRGMKTGFYLIYPIHIFILDLLAFTVL